MNKVKKITLAFIRHPNPIVPKAVPVYRVIKVQHTTDFNPGDELCKGDVDVLNASRHWDVTVVAS